MRIAVVIPTYKRIKKLERCLWSLAKQTYQNFDVHIYCDNNDHETLDWLRTKDNVVNRFINYVSVNTKQEFVIGSWNKFFKQYHENYDAVQWLVDDVEVSENFLAEMLAMMIKEFPDTDGVIGSKQICPGREDYTFKWYGQPLIGRKFIERYKEVNYQVCCPDYNHFYQDEEMFEYANSLAKWNVAKDAVLKHYHPSFLPDELDDTHPLVRGVIQKIDNATRWERQQKNLNWGNSFKRVR